jgi:predicted ATPase
VEGNVEIGEILGSSAAGAREERRDAPPERAARATSTFKVEILRALMKRAGLFEDTAAASNGDDLEQLNKLTMRFAGGVIERLRPSRDNSIDLRVSPAGGGPSYSFDGLSSGQKEIIATLFLVWKHTHDQPSVVLIDEPELHLNAEWHRSFVRALCDLPGDNQYILATHSEDIFASVDEERRVLLSSPPPAAEP